MVALELGGVRALRGPNVYARCSVVTAFLAHPGGFDAAGVAELAAVLARGAGAACGYHTAIREGAGSRLVVQNEVEELTRRSLSLALRIRAGEWRGAEFDSSGEVAELNALGASLCLGPNTRAIAEAARARGIPVRRLDAGSLLQLGHGCRQRRMCGAETDRTSSIAEEIGWQKPLAKQLLRAVGVPVPEGREVLDAEDAWRAAQEAGGTVAVKPKCANHGRAVFLGLSERADIEAAYRAASAEAEDQGVLVERCIPGAEHRILVVHGAVVAVTRGDPLYVTGDGQRTLAELVGEVNLDPRRGDSADCPLSPVEFDDVVLATLAQQGHGPASVPANGERVLIQRNGNLAADVTDRIHPANAALAALAARTVGLDIAGVDAVVEDIAAPMREQGGAVLEVNAMPGLMMHLRPGTGRPRPVHERIVDAVYPPGEDGRIPIVAVLGPVAARAVREVAAALKRGGLLTGAASSDGTFVDGERTHSGNRATADAAADLFLHPLIEAAVVEVDERNAVECGLGFDRCAVALVAREGAAADLVLSTVAPGGLVLRSFAHDVAAAVLAHLEETGESHG